METVIYDQTPLADYLKDEGEEEHETWEAPAEFEGRDESPAPSPPPSPSFAPVGRPLVKKRFRSNIPDALRLDTCSIGSRRVSNLAAFHEKYTKAVASSIDRAGNSKFLEQFRYTIIASQLLSGHSVLGHRLNNGTGDGSATSADMVVPTSSGLMVTAAGAVAVAWLVSWVYAGGYTHLTRKRIPFVTLLLIAVAVLSHAYIRQQWLRFVREQALVEVATFVHRSQDFDSAISAVISLIQEVELVSRGYRISAPLPPISRIEDKSQTRRCARLRKALKTQFTEMMQKYDQVLAVIKGFSEQLDLEKYYDIYDISDLDISDALQGYSEKTFDDAESLRSLKIGAARFHTIRKMFLCALLSLEARGENADFLRWSTAVEGLRTLNEATLEAYTRIRSILSDEESFNVAPASQLPASPGRERWRSQLRKLGSLSTGIRGLQAKLTLLREESDRSLNEAEDISELGPNLMSQYESIGQDLKLLTQAWEEGRAALASCINRNEKRLSSLSTLLSPVSSLSGLTTVEEGGAVEAFKALTGDSPPESTFASPRGEESEEAEVFEAVSLPPRPRSLFTREERLVRMREEREERKSVRERTEASRGMLRELEMVINLRPNRSSGVPSSSALTPRVSI